MQVRKDTWKQLDTILPCEACVAGKLRKFHKIRPTEFFPIKNLEQSVKNNGVGEQNRLVAVDWGIVKSECRNKNTVFALYVDQSIGLVMSTQLHPGEMQETLSTDIFNNGVPLQKS